MQSWHRTYTFSGQVAKSGQDTMGVNHTKGCSGKYTVLESDQIREIRRHEETVKSEHMGQ